MDNEKKKRLMRFGEVVDALISKDYTARGISHELYEDVRQQIQNPLTMSAVLALAERVKMGDRVMIFTGWPSRSWLIQGLTETDGPVGAAILARAMEEAFGIVPLLVMEESMGHFGEVGLRAAGLIVSDLETALASKPGPPRASVAAVIHIPTSIKETRKEVDKLLEKIDPKALISIELPGANADYTYHNVTCREVPTELVIKADEYFRAAAERNILTIAVGDGGNELGMANAATAIRRYLKHGEQILPATPVDHLVVSCISNWGALGIAACIAAVSEQAEVFSHIDIMRITDKLSDAGAIDGLTAYVDPKNDGTAYQVNVGLTAMLSLSLQMYMNGWQKK